MLLYEEVSARISEMITKGTYRSGERIPWEGWLKGWFKGLGEWRGPTVHRFNGVLPIAGLSPP